ncbi:c-type cytochrome [Roseomonas populi]|uniref:C-type cytochrome n=1 Tax=Roseomonas populi TaxID=3121582 RepID=A0ABT1XBG0_9PROT|nr:cytochrome c [Roseomonas pecuniae]MCR0985044.1 c-type cytochrome [Roseomonas pecuniae]
MKPVWRHLLIAGLAGSVLAAGVALALAWEPAIGRVPRPDPAGFDPAIVARGATLATIGDCAVCHTAPSGAPYAGGRALGTPFGTLYATNITPDEATGLGNWSPAAFRRAMKDGVRRDGEHLYPALPYEHFTHVRDDDLDAIYAFLMTRRAVDSPAPPNALIPPLGFRPLLAGWKLLFLHRGPVEPVPERGEAWNRGAYLVEGLGHCGGCHTPRNLAGGEQGRRSLAGGVAEGWNAPPLDGSAGGWSIDALVTYLGTGLHSSRGVAAGPMGPVTEGLSQVPAEDLRAIATYIASRTGNAAPVPVQERAEEAARAHPEGAGLFAGACAACHGGGAPMLARNRPGLGTATPILAADPRNAIQAVLQGIPAPVGPDRPFMPPFSDALGDRQLAEILAYARARFTAEPPWRDLQESVTRIRKENTRP